MLLDCISLQNRRIWRCAIPNRATLPQGEGADPFVARQVEQIRVLKLVDDERLSADGATSPRPSPPAERGKTYACVVEVWQPKEPKKKSDKVEWQLVESRVPLRLGKPLPLIPFVFHGPRHSLPAVAKLPLEDVISVNLDHYRLNADYKHGLHYTALPTAWVSGFDKSATLRIGSGTAWVSETPGATAGYLEFHGQGLMTFERAMDRAERLMTLVGSRLLESQKKAIETAKSLQLKQSGENSILANIATSVSESLTQVLRWAYWWNSTEDIPEHVTDDQALFELNTDYDASGMLSDELKAVVAAWQAGAISQDSMLELFRKGEILPDARTNQREAELIVEERSAVIAAAAAAGARATSLPTATGSATELTQTKT